MARVLWGYILGVPLVWENAGRFGLERRSRGLGFGVDGLGLIM